MKRDVLLIGMCTYAFVCVLMHRKANIWASNLQDCLRTKRCRETKERISRYWKGYGSHQKKVQTGDYWSHAGGRLLQLHSNLHTLLLISSDIIAQLQERDQVSAEVAAAQMQGYRNELLRQQRGRTGQITGEGPRVREPEGGFSKDKVKDREMYRKRQVAGGGVTSDNLAVQERDWQITVASLFSNLSQ